jgi:predicted negative regulator of RcsB-dependent stress response
VGTTKLTRKEIMAEDPIHESMIRLIEFFQVNGKKIGVMAIIVLLIAVGIYEGLQYLDFRQEQMQAQLAKGIDFFHAQVQPDAADDPYAKGPAPVFKSDAVKYQAAAKEFATIAAGFGASKLSVIARYYLGLSQLQLGQKSEAIQNLEKAANSSRERTIAYLAKRVLASNYINDKNYKSARELLEGMIRDPQYDLPKEDLNLDLAKMLAAQGKRDEAIKVLREASAQSQQLSSQKQRLMAEIDKLQKKSKSGS